MNPCPHRIGTGGAFPGEDLILCYVYCFLVEVVGNGEWGLLMTGQGCSFVNHYILDGMKPFFECVG